MVEVKKLKDRGLHKQRPHRSRHRSCREYEGTRQETEINWGLNLGSSMTAANMFGGRNRHAPCIHKAQGHLHKRMAFSERSGKTTFVGFNDAHDTMKHPPANKFDYENAVDIIQQEPA